ncbi:hypothetical protein VUR80DRAFT_3763 [Thermomyces stellatus]
MRTQVLVLLGAAAAGLTQDINATVVTWNPPDACYIARLEGAINVRARASSDVFGLGFNFHVSLDGLPEDQDPFGVDYYLNENPVPEDGNCTETEGHLDPFGRTDDPPCDDDEAQSCVAGDLSGRHGTLEPPTGEIRNNHAPIRSQLLSQPELHSSNFPPSRILLLSQAGQPRGRSQDRPSVSGQRRTHQGTRKGDGEFDDDFDFGDDFEDEYGGGGGGDDDDDDEEFDEDFDFGDEFRGKFGDGDGGFDGDFDEDFGGDFDFGDE